MDKPIIAIVKISDAFEHFWSELADAIDAVVCLPDPNHPEQIPSSSALIVLAAGGAEEQALEWLEQSRPPIDAPIIAVGVDTSRRTTSRMVARGAQDYLALPEDVEIFRNTVSAAVEAKRVALQHSARADSRADSDSFAPIVGESPAIKALLTRSRRLLQHVNATVLITGETGTGKELLAQALHDGGPRGNGPFVPVNCAALPENLIESELFGHEKGAFSGAHAAKPGLFEVAKDGTIFLDEIGELPLEVQAKLLRVLDQKTIRRVGGTDTIKVNARVMAATHVDLAKAVSEGRFREDLYFRLSVILLDVPPLRARDNDVAIITDALIGRLSEEHCIEAPTISAEARSLLRACEWRGNVRELKNALERALLFSDEGELCLDELQPSNSPRPVLSGDSHPAPEQLEAIIRSSVEHTLNRCDGNRSEAARSLGITRKRLKRILDRPTAGTESEDGVFAVSPQFNMA